MATGIVKVLGCGASGGVPLATGFWGNCDPQNPKNLRTRASISVTLGGNTLVVDTGPDFRQQTLRENITRIDGILYTHAHSDHVHGIDDLRYVKFIQKDLIHAYGDLDTLNELQSRFAHMFTASADGLYQPVIEPHAFADEDYGRYQPIAGMDVMPIWQHHGTAGHSLGYRFGDFAYSTDVSRMDDTAFNALAGIKTWLVDCAQFDTDYVIVHPNFEMVHGWNDRVKAQRVILTHLTPRVDFEKTRAKLPEGYEPAYDGMEIEIHTGV